MGATTGATMTTVYTRTTCPLGRKMSEPCPMHPRQTVEDKCNACLDEWQERAALIADGCRLTQQQAEAEATKKLRDAVDKAENRQGRLF
jgi:hypothetical protein